MKIALCRSFAPFDPSVDDALIEKLGCLLPAHGHEVEIVRLPLAEEAAGLMTQLAAYRWVDLTAADRIICFAPAGHLIPHPCKIVLFSRALADLLPPPHASAMPGLRRDGLARAVEAMDGAALREARRVWATSRPAAEQLSRLFGIAADILPSSAEDADWRTKADETLLAGLLS